jgi:hypothetical protein
MGGDKHTESEVCVNGFQAAREMYLLVVVRETSTEQGTRTRTSTQTSQITNGVVSTRDTVRTLMRSHRRRKAMGGHSTCALAARRKCGRPGKEHEPETRGWGWDD